MPLVINSLGGRHTHTQTHTCTHTDDPHRINFKKPGALVCGRRTPGLKVCNRTSDSYICISNVHNVHTYIHTCSQINTPCDDCVVLLTLVVAEVTADVTVDA